ncbi:MAG TPA: ABC transporter ATP-binding protein [Candidatus Wallbacteria bacterium]|nr:ABC transporter ATP-binding protein [Candidatus Wallbacteria bacterium]
MYALSMRAISKSFKKVVANDNITFSVKKNTIHGLVGENGAGKSTLMNILYGLLEPDSGEIFIDEKQVRFDGPKDAIEAGIGMVHQHFMLAGPLTVTENIILGSEPEGGLFLDYKKARSFVVELSERYGLKVDPDARIDSISVGLAQRVEILKTLYRGARIIVLDEPTAVLTPQEVGDLLKIMDKLRKDGVTIVFISHKLREVKRITDEITVIRAGKTIGTRATRDVDENEIAKMMVGREVSFKVDKKPCEPGEVKISVNALEAYNDKGLKCLKNLSFQIRRGEVFAIAGVEGNGQSELLDVLGGMRKPCGGAIKLFDNNMKETDITGLSPYKIYDNRVAHIPEDRHKRGLQLKFNIKENLVTSLIHKWPFANPFGMINSGAINKNAADKIGAFDIRCGSAEIKAQNLSGGNQQKIVIARELSKQPEFIIIAQPTRGVDIGAIEFIHKKIIELRDSGVAILLISAELSEIINLSDRIGVIYNGELLEVMNAADASEEKLGLLMVGISKNKTDGGKVSDKNA